MATKVQQRNVVIPSLIQGQHIVIVGPTGSGKTILADRFLRSFPWVVALDSKGELHWKNYKETHHLEIVTQKLASHVMLAPDPDSYLSTAIRLFEIVYRMKGWLFYVDEVYSLGYSYSMFPKGFIKLLTRGRSRGVTVATGTQRPRFLPLFVFTESTHFFIFRVTSEDDLKVIEKQTTKQVARLVSELDRYEFVYYNKLTGETVKSIPLKL